VTQVRRRSRTASQSVISQVHTRRAYSDGRNGQLHLNTAYPSGGGFDERTALVCLHPEAATGVWFKGLLPELGRDRSVYAPDLPAHGHSDPAIGTALSLDDHVAAIGDLLDSMRLRHVDLLGHELGARIAADLAAARPEQVRRVVLIALPDTVEDPGAAPAAVRTPQLAARAVAARLAAVKQPTLLLHPADMPAGSRRPEATLPQHSASALAQRSEELYGTGARELARTLRAFLDR
jgi:pimeloyl-ACP methyl ester carboxylesterase